MKKRITRLIVAAFVAIIMSGISACKNNETKKTDDFADLIAARDAALDTDDGYTFARHFVLSRGENSRTINLSETKNGNKYYSVEEHESVLNGVKRRESKTTKVIKTVTVDGVERTKLYEKTESPESGEIFSESGRYVAPDKAEEEMSYSPADAMEEYLIGKGETYDDICKIIVDECETDDISFSLERGDDDSVTFGYAMEYRRESDSSEDSYSIVGTYKARIIAKDGKITEVGYDDEYEVVYEDVTKNFTESDCETINFSYNDFDDAFYNGISVETDTTENEYIGYIEFKINGYMYSPTMYVPVGDTVTNADVMNFFGDFDTQSTFITIRSEVLLPQISIFIDKAMTTPFTAITVDEYRGRTMLYVRMTPPTDKAWVISVIDIYDENNNYKYQMIRYVQGTMSQGDTAYFNADNSLSGHRVISVDGGEPSADGKYYFDKGTIHVFVIER